MVNCSNTLAIGSCLNTEHHYVSMSWRLFSSRGSLQHHREPSQRPRRTWPNLEDLKNSMGKRRKLADGNHGENGAGVDILHILRWQFMSRYCWDQGDWGSFINPTYNPNVTRLVDLECKVISSFHILWLRANHFRVATENWWKLIKQLLFSGSFHISTNIVELVSLAQLYTITDCLSQVLCVQWPGPSSKNSAQTWQIPKKPDDQETSHLSNILLLLLVLQPSLNLPFITQKAVPFSHPKTCHRPDVRVPLPRYLWRVPWQRPRPGRKGPGGLYPPGN